MSFPLTPPPDDKEEGLIDTPTYLIPLSPSALSSSQLQENKERLASATTLRQISDLENISSNYSAGVSIALRLAPRLETSCYTIGSDSRSDIVIQTETEDECYVNLQHCRLTPDPDRAAITVSNKSLTIFTVQNIDKRDTQVKILPTHAISISQGEWYVTLGRGLEFLVIVLPRDPDIDQGLLIHGGRSKKQASSTPQQESSMKKGRNARYRKHQRRKTRELVPFTRRIDLLIPSSGSSDGNSRREEIITSTDQTKVLKCQRRGIVVAAKKFRHARLDLAAEIWENEKEILEHLKKEPQNVSFLSMINGSHR